MIKLASSLIFAVLVPPSAYGQATLRSQCELHVSVRDSAGRPQRANLLLIGTDLSFRTTQTDSSGEAGFVRLPEDEFTLVVRPGNGQETEDRISTRSGGCVQSETVQLTAPDKSSRAGNVYVGDLKAPKKAHKLYEKGLAELQRQRWRDAKLLFERAVAAYPDFPGAYNSLGIAASECKDFEKANTAFREAIRLRKNYSEAYLNYAKSLIRQQRFSDVELLMNNLLAYDHVNRNATTVLVESLFWQRKFHAVIELVQEVHAKGYAHDAFIHEYAAEIYRRLGMMQEFERENATIAAESWRRR